MELLLCYSFSNILLLYFTGNLRRCLTHQDDVRQHLYEVQLLELCILPFYIVNNHKIEERQHL